MPPTPLPRPAVQPVGLTGIPGSHPVLAVQLMLEYKRIAYVRRDLPNQLQKLLLPLAGYPGRTVPVIRIDGRRVQGSTTIARVLDQLAPAPPLFPADEVGRRRVVELETWADAELQETVRTLAQWAAKQEPRAVAPIAAGSALPLPPRLLRVLVPVMAPAMLATLRVARDDARRAMAALPASLDRIDRAIEQGVLGSDRPTAADFQVATCVRLATLIDGLRPILADRPATALAHRIAPDYPGHLTAPLRLRPVPPE